MIIQDLLEVCYTFSRSIIIKTFPLQQYNTVPQTPLLTSQILKEENENWSDIQQEMSTALGEMRVDPPPITVKNFNDSNASLLAKRLNKAAAAKTVPSTIMENQMSTEENT